MVISIFVVPLNWLHKCQKEKRLVNFAWYSGFKWRPSQIWKSKGIWALRNLHTEWMTNGTSFEKIQHLSVMVGFKMDAKTLFERLFEFMLLNENWMKWDNWLFVCCALGDPIIAGLYWISCKLLIVIQFLHQAGNQEKYKIATIFLHDFAIFLLSWFRSERLSCLKWKNIQLPVVFWDDL